MSDCEGDFKCRWCKGDGTIEPDDKYGACKEAILHDEIDEYQQREDEIIVALGSSGILPSEIVKEIERLTTTADKLADELTKDEIKNKLEYLGNIESRFFGWSLSVQQEVDFAWVVRELKKRLK